MKKAVSRVSHELLTGVTPLAKRFILLFLQVSGFSSIKTRKQTGASQLGLIKGFIETK